MAARGITSIVVVLLFKVEWEFILLLQSCWLIPTLVLVRWGDVLASLFVYILVNSVAFYAVYAQSGFSWALILALTYTMGMVTDAIEINRKDGAQVEVTPSGVGDGA